MKLTSLGDRVLILGMVCSFSVAASDLGVSKGNCVICKHDSFLHSSMGCVFDLDDGRLTPLSDSPEYFNLFWPRPMWIAKS